MCILLNNRIEQLDSIRGLASLTVVFNHIFNVYAFYILSTLFNSYLPFKIFISGHAAVIMFFILSGFVLSMPLIKGRKIEYKSFIIKRIFRIYLPYLIAIICAMVLSMLLSKGGISELSDWFNLSWEKPIKFSVILEHLILIDNAHTNTFDNAVWSLTHEMRISIIFPVIYFIVIKYNWKVNLGIAAFLSFITGLNDHFHIETSNGYFTSYFDTLHYASMFIIGGLLVKHLNKLIEIYSKLTKVKKWGLLLLAFCLYTYSGIIGTLFSKLGLPMERIARDYVIALGSSLFILLAIGSRKLTYILGFQSIRFLGKISYSLYLYHLIILYSLIYLLYQQIPLWGIYILTVIISILVASASYYYIELPFIHLGRKTAKKLGSNKFSNSTYVNRNI